ncbi:MAG TPA: TolC family protein [Gemmatimonadota bacterium]|nr:TolC family protein [Gemmatimonadota bacterium]
MQALPIATVALCALLAVSAAPAQEAAGMRRVSLEEAIRLALERSPAAISAQSAVRFAEADVLESRGAWFPSLSATSSFSNSSNERFDQSTGRLVSESYTAQLQAGYDLFTGGRRWNERRRASAELRAAVADDRAQRFETILTTTEFFYEAAATAQIAEAASQRLERARRQLEFAETRLRVGSATRSDVLRAELEVGNAEIALIDAETAERSSRLELGRQIGVEDGAEPTEDALPESAPELPDTESLVAWATGRAPEVVATTAALDAARATRWAAMGTYLPTLRATGGYDWFAFDFPPDQRSWSLRLSASFPLFDNFGREAEVARTSAVQRLAEAEARDATIGVRVEVENAAREVEAAERRASIARRAVDLAREDLRVQEERYRIGGATILDLQTSQVALADQEIAWVRARQTLGVAMASLESVLGASLEEVDR